MNKKSYDQHYYRTSWPRRFTVLLGAAKSRKKNEVTITPDYLLTQLTIQQSRCYYTGEVLSLDPADKYDAVSLDRMDNTLGYIQGNVVLTTWRINRAKSNFTHEAFINLCRSVTNYHAIRRPDLFAKLANDHGW